MLHFLLSLFLYIWLFQKFSIYTRVTNKKENIPKYILQTKSKKEQTLQFACHLRPFAWEIRPFKEPLHLRHRLSRLLRSAIRIQSWRKPPPESVIPSATQRVFSCTLHTAQYVFSYITGTNEFCQYETCKNYIISNKASILRIGNLNVFTPEIYLSL